MQVYIFEGANSHVQSKYNQGDSRNVCFAAVRKQNQASEFGSLYYFVSFLISRGIVTMRDPLLKMKYLQTSNFRYKSFQRFLVDF